MNLLAINDPIVSSNKNWTVIKSISKKFEQDSLPAFTMDDLVKNPDSKSKSSLMLLDRKMGVFLYNPEIRLFAISYSIAMMEDEEIVHLIKIRSWYLNGGKWIHFRDGTVLRNGIDVDRRNEFPAASKYCRSLMMKLAKAESKEKFRLMLASSNRFCLKWTSDF